VDAVTWIIQSAAFPDSDVVERLSLAAEEVGGKVHFVPYKPFMSHTMFADTLPTISDDSPVIVHGCIAFVKACQRSIPNAPVAWADWHELCCTHYYPQYGKYLVQQRWCMMPFGSLGRQSLWLYNTLAINPNDPQLFFRPNENTKRFAGQVVAINEFENWYRATAHYTAPDDLVVISRTSKLQREWRLVIHEQKVVTGSCYLDEGVLQQLPRQGYPMPVKWYAEEVAHHWSPHRMYVMDIAEVDVGNQFPDLRLLEIGSFNCAGLYGADVHAVAQAAHDAAIAYWNEEHI
jgi:hypothetical protein